MSKIRTGKIGIRALLLILALMSACKPRHEQAANPLEASLHDSTKKFFSFFSPVSIREFLEDEWQRFRISSGLDIFRLEPTNWAQITGRYRYEVRSQGDQSHLRMDRWKIGTSINAGSLLSRVTDGIREELPVNLNITSGSEVVFIRRFATKNEAVFAIPRPLIDMPLNLKSIAKLQPGELVSIPVSMGLHLSLGAHQGWSHLDGRVSMGLFWRGTYRLNIARESGSWLRVTLIPTRTRGWNAFANAGINLDYFGYGPFGLIDLDRQVDKQLGLQFMEMVKTHTTLQRTSIFEYQYDLASTEAAAAVDELLNKTLTFNANELRDLPHNWDGNLTYGNLDKTEFLANTTPHVRKTLVAAEDSTADHESGHLGTLLWRFQGHESVSTHNLAVASSDTGRGRDQPGRFRIRNYQHQSGLKALLEPLQENHSVSLHSLSDTAQTDGFRDFTFHWQVDDKLLTGDEVHDYLTTVATLFASYQLKLPSIASNKSYRKFKSNLALTFEEGYFSTLRQRDPADIQRFFYEAMATLSSRYKNRYGLHTVVPEQNFLDQVRASFKRGFDKTRNLVESVLNWRISGVNYSTGKDILNISGRVHSDPVDEVIAGYIELAKRDRLSHELLPAFLLEVARLGQLPFVVGFDVTSEDSPPYSQHYGNRAFLDLHDQLGYILSHINAEQY